jgi:hypothetical protein
MRTVVTARCCCSDSESERNEGIGRSLFVGPLLPLVLAQMIGVVAQELRLHAHERPNERIAESRFQSHRHARHAITSGSHLDVLQRLDERVEGLSGDSCGMHVSERYDASVTLFGATRRGSGADALPIDVRASARLKGATAAMMSSECPER